MAHGGSFPYYDAKEFDCRILGLPYKHNLTTMYIILPNNSNRQRLRDMQAYLTADKIENMIAKMEWKTAIVLFPKLHITNQMNMKQMLQQLGVNSLFERRNSDLSLLSNGQDGEASPLPASASIPAYAPVADRNSFAPQYQPQSYASQGTVQRAPQPFPVFNPNYKNQMVSLIDDSNDDAPFLFSRHGDDNDDDDSDTKTSTTEGATTQPKNSSKQTIKPETATEKQRRKRSVTYKVQSTARKSEEPLRLKDYIISKRITKSNPTGKKYIRSKRQTDLSESIKQLDQLRDQLSQGVGGTNPGLYAEDIVHKIDLTVNEKGTEGGAATVTYLYRTGTDAVFRVETPFIFMIRHDDTKLPLFYGTVYEPTNF